MLSRVSLLNEAYGAVTQGKQMYVLVVGSLLADEAHNYFHPRIRVLQPTSGFYSGSGQISKSQVLSELEFTLGQKERALQANPYDSVSQNHLNVLLQVCWFPAVTFMV